MILSIIVPVYNVEKYLERCVDSLIDQNLDIEDYEIILVNDGSTDDSQKVAECLVDKYSNVSLYCQENRGLSGARNTGMKYAQGNYIMFVDSDDFLNGNCLKQLIDACELYDLDVCHFRYITWPDRKISSVGTLRFNTLYCGVDVIKDGHLICSACLNVYKFDVIRKHKLSFYEGITHEDVEFTTRLFCHVERVMVLEDVIYNYVFNSLSLSKDLNFDKENKYVTDSAVIARLAKEYVIRNIEDDEVRNLVLRRVNTSVATHLYGLLKCPNRSYTIVKNLLYSYHINGLYPIRGEHLTLKSKLVGFFLGNSKFYLLLYSCLRRRKEKVSRKKENI